MIRTVLVPLDGSSLSERALPIAVHVAKAAQADLKLVHVEPPHNHHDHPLPPTAQGYLDLMSWKVRQMAGVPATSALLQGPTAESLLECAHNAPADLVVMTTHGRGVLERFWLGSIADKLVQRTNVPLLLLHPNQPPQHEGFRKILIPLDGSRCAERAIGPATELGKLSDAEYSLLRVVEPTPVMAADGMTYLPNAVGGDILDVQVAEAEKYLAGVVERLRGEGLRVTSQVVVGESATTGILDAAKAADLTAIATHGRSGLARLFLGSVADTVERTTEGPVLIVRSPGEDEI